MEGESNTVVATALEESAIVMDYGMLQRLRLSVTSLDLKVYVIWYLIYLCVCVCVCLHVYVCLCVCYHINGNIIHLHAHRKAVCRINCRTIIQDFAQGGT